MNWAFWDIVQEGLSRGYKAKWAVYRAKDFGIALTLDDIKELGEMYGHKTMWAYHTAKEFRIPPFDKIKSEEAEQPKKPIYPDHYFKGIYNKEDLKKAFRNWSKTLHPDLEGGNHTEFIRMVNQYENLKRRV